jgi:hypothetical protein
MTNILIQTPNEAQKNEWLTCEVHSVSFNNNSNSGTITVKGVVPSKLVSTPIVIMDLEALLKQEVVKSKHGHYKLHLANEASLNTLKTLYYGK